METDYYNYLNHSPLVVSPIWNNSKINRKNVLKFDETRKYFPVMVLLKRVKDNKGVFKLVLDNQTH